MSILLGGSLVVLCAVWYFYQYQTLKIKELREQDRVDTIESKSVEAQANPEIK